MDSGHVSGGLLDAGFSTGPSLFGVHLPSARLEVGSSGCVLIPIRVFETSHCLQVESDCGLRPVGCVMDRGSLSCGYYQIKEPYWIDCGRPGGGTHGFCLLLLTIHTIYSYSAISNLIAGWKKCANDYVCARYAFTCTRRADSQSITSSASSHAMLYSRRGCVKAYMKRYGHICTKSISPLTCEQVSRIHNGGPFGCRNDNTLPYWNKVAKCYNPKYGM